MKLPGGLGRGLGLSRIGASIPKTRIVCRNE